MKTVLIVGATGAQGGAVTQYLASTNQYRLLAFTRSAMSAQAKILSKLPNVQLIINDVQSGYDVDAFLAAASESDAVFVNTDGFAIGEIAETYWGIRFFELASRVGVKHFIYSGLDYNGKASGYDPKYYVLHYEAKARVQEWLHAQQNSFTKWTIIRLGPYIETLAETMLPSEDSSGTVLFQLPLQGGAIPFIVLSDFGKYVHWALSHLNDSAYLDFGVATEHATGKDIATAFTAHTGRPARYIDIPVETWNEAAWADLPKNQDTKIGFRSVRDETQLTLSYGENFTNWWNLYRASAENKGLIRRDYAFLDNILPDRVRSAAEWMENVDYIGDRVPLLKDLMAE